MTEGKQKPTNANTDEADIALTLSDIASLLNGCQIYVKVEGIEPHLIVELSKKL